MQTVIETPTFIKAAARTGMSEAEVTMVVDLIAANPEVGEVIQGTGGCRKVRVAGRGKGKSGGYRLFTLLQRASNPSVLVDDHQQGRHRQSDQKRTERARGLNEGTDCQLSLRATVARREKEKHDEQEDPQEV